MNQSNPVGKVIGYFGLDVRGKDSLNERMWGSYPTDNMACG